RPAACAAGLARVKGGIMRAVTLGDLMAAAQVLCDAPEGEWAGVMAQLLAEAHEADAYRRAQGRAHARLGAGTLMAAALARAPAPCPPVSDPRCLAALAAVLRGIHDFPLSPVPARPYMSAHGPDTPFATE
ncbi:MAG: hypothetical protein ACK4HW_11755, partial [Roseinatronobacter sp.]